MTVFMIFALAPEGNALQQGPQQSQIKGIISITTAMFNFTFQQTWVAYFIKLFHSKQQIITFFECFNEAYHYSTQQSHMEIEEDMHNKDIQVETLDVLELQPNQASSNRPKQETKSDFVTNRLSHTQYLSLLQSIIASNPYIRLQSIQQRLKQLTSQQPPSLQSIEDMLKSLNYRQVHLNKTSLDRSSMVNLQNRYKYCFEYHKLIQSKAVLFIDACKVDMNMGTEWAWVKERQGVFQRINDDYIQLIACLAQNESLIYHVQKRFKGNTMNYAAKIEMITNKLKARHQQENMVVVIDNSNIPISTSIKRIVKRQNMRLFVLPPLSPQLNPLHFFFSQLKASIRSSASNITSLDQLQQFVAKMCSQPKENRNSFEYMKGYLMKGLTKTYF